MDPRYDAHSLETQPGAEQQGSNAMLYEDAYSGGAHAGVNLNDVTTETNQVGQSSALQPMILVDGSVMNSDPRYSDGTFERGYMPSGTLHDMPQDCCPPNRGGGKVGVPPRPPIDYLPYPIPGPDGTVGPGLPMVPPRDYFPYPRTPEGTIGRSIPREPARDYPLPSPDGTVEPSIPVDPSQEIPSANKSPDGTVDPSIPLDPSQEIPSAIPSPDGTVEPSIPLDPLQEIPSANTSPDGTVEPGASSAPSNTTSPEELPGPDGEFLKK